MASLATGSETTLRAEYARQFYPGDVVCLVADRHKSEPFRDRYTVFEAVRRERCGGETLTEYGLRKVDAYSAMTISVTAAEIEDAPAPADLPAKLPDAALAPEPADAFAAGVYAEHGNPIA